MASNQKRAKAQEQRNRSSKNVGIRKAKRHLEEYFGEEAWVEQGGPTGLSLHFPMPDYSGYEEWFEALDEAISELRLGSILEMGVRDLMVPIPPSKAEAFVSVFDQLYSDPEGDTPLVY